MLSLRIRQAPHFIYSKNKRACLIFLKINPWGTLYNNRYLENSYGNIKHRFSEQVTP